MNTILKKISTLIFLCLLAKGVAAQSLPPRHFSHPERIRYDQHCFTIEGKDVFVFSAAFHYFRVPQELWRERFRKIKDAGFNTVETYVPWNWHERNMPKDINDFSQCNFDDLKVWLKMAHEEFGLYTIVRPGPFICAEWAGGGYPRWLGKFCPKQYETIFWLRSNHPEHMKWAKHWYDAVLPVFASEQLTHKKEGEKGIIMVQVENEYIYFGMEWERKEEFLKELTSSCIEHDIEVPLFTCVTPEVRGSKDAVISQLFDMDNLYLWWNMQEAKPRMEELRRKQSNAPAFVCELQGGWFSTIGGSLSEDFRLDGKHARGMALMSMAGGATGLNYYMFFGGTHLVGWGARRMTTSYDYGAPLKENGGIGEKYAAVKGVGEFITRFGTQLARAEQIKFETSANPETLVVGASKAVDGTLFVFFMNKNKSEAYKENIRITFEDGTCTNVFCSLAPLDSKVFVLRHASQQGEWYPKEQALPERPSCMPSAIRVTTAEKCNERFDGQWENLKKGVSLPELGVNDCRYSMYRSKVNLTSAEVKEYGTLLFEMFTGDPVYVQVNGKLAQRASTDELDNTFRVDGILKKGVNDIVAIYENRGHSHGYRPMEELSGIRTAGLGKKQSSILPIESWEVKEVTGKEKEIGKVLQSNDSWEAILLDQETIAGLATLQIAGLEKPKWPAAWVLQSKKGTAVYRTTIDFTPEMIADGKTMLEFACVDDRGTLWVNGKEVAEHNAWDKPFLVNIASHIQPGKNEIAIVVTNNNGAGGLLKGVRLLSRQKIEKSLQWQVSKDLGGVLHGYCDKNNLKGIWTEIALDDKEALPRKGSNTQPVRDRDALFTWYKVTFRLPQQEQGIWMPWRAIIKASGTGYIWLNGHNIGRHWEEGPQREFYLPECWLNFKDTNTLILGLRQSEINGTSLDGVEIAPYYEDAEIRSN